MVLCAIELLLQTPDRIEQKGLSLIVILLAFLEPSTLVGLEVFLSKTGGFCWIKKLLLF